MELLVIVDMQRDFIDGALGTKEAVAILSYVENAIKSHKGKVLFTRDTHDAAYLETQEGNKLPVPHCIRNTEGWQIHPSLAPLVRSDPIDKETFGSVKLGRMVADMTDVSAVTLMGLCTDICVVSNALIIKATFPDAAVKVDRTCCAGVTPDSHNAALTTMAMCQIDVIGG